MKTFDSKAFGKLMTAVKRAGITVRDGMQDMIEMGLSVYKENGDTSYLTKCIETCMHIKSVKAQDVAAYIKAHANVRWHKSKEGSQFVKVSKKRSINVREPEQTWYEYTKQAEVKADFDYIARAKSLITSLDKALKEGKIKGNQTKAEQFHNHLQQLIGASEA